MNICTFQIYQCRITVDIDKTTAYYAEQNLITDDCDCEDCRHYAENVISKDVRVFQILSKFCHLPSISILLFSKFSLIS